jgi:hypothetical protein
MACSGTALPFLPLLNIFNMHFHNRQALNKLNIGVVHFKVMMMYVLIPLFPIS